MDFLGFYDFCIFVEARWMKTALKAYEIIFLRKRFKLIPPKSTAPCKEILIVRKQYHLARSNCF